MLSGEEGLLPFLIRAMEEMKDFPGFVRTNAIGGNQVVWIEASKVTNCQGAVFNDGKHASPCATHSLVSDHKSLVAHLLDHTEAVPGLKILLPFVLAEVSFDDHRATSKGSV